MAAEKLICFKRELSALRSPPSPNLRQSPFCTPIRGPNCAPIDRRRTIAAVTSRLAETLETHGPGRHHGTRLPFLIPRLGRGANDLRRSIAEAALGHIVGDKVEAAYRRGDLFEKRQKLMEAWAAYCMTPVEEAEGARSKDRGAWPCPYATMAR